MPEDIHLTNLADPANLKHLNQNLWDTRDALTALQKRPIPNIAKLETRLAQLEARVAKLEHP